MDFKKISKKREIQGAKDIGGRVHPASGARWHTKGDFSNQFIHVEDKFFCSNNNSSDTYSISLDVLHKVEKEAFSIGKTPVLKFGLYNARQTYNNKDFAVINRDHIIKPINYSRENQVSTSKKSYLVRINQLEDIYINNNDILLHLTFTKANKVFVVMKWEYFLENMDLIIEEN